ncbi:hypothetical protein [Deinococcus arcticus]|uniref:Uncharacterized protein n=1 Tax=Deinococcus arcticus TaxID=2136176 RepID=A0A2T3WAK6_9DEIO|nr:hypothetical protein [Deinococcus arcticus]PTA68948.1 hypothetical protein C8263_03860 [Deinococcus arcticus]
MNHLLALALAVLAPSALAAPVTQYALLKAAKVQGGLMTMTLDYIEVFSGAPEDAARAVRLGYYPDTRAFQAALPPSGLLTRNVNPQLRTLKTDARTVFELSCAEKPGVDTANIVPKPVSLTRFVASWKGQPGACWPFAGEVVRLRLDGTRVLKVSQVYFP